MCIYCTTNNYRKIYENHIGPIPKDEQGRTHEIHHIDGNSRNNAIDNLLCVSINDHYQIHKDQGDWAACLLIAQRIGSYTPEEKAELARLHAMKRISLGTHNFQHLTVEERRDIQLRRLADSSHPFCTSKNPVYQQLADGSHPFIGGEVQKKVSTKTNYRR